MVANLLAIGVLAGDPRARPPAAAGGRADGEAPAARCAVWGARARSSGPRREDDAAARRQRRRSRSSSRRSSRRGAAPGAVRGRRPCRGRRACLVRVARRARRREEDEQVLQARRSARSVPRRRRRRPARRTSTSRTCSRRTSSRAAPARGFPVEEIAGAVAARLGEARHRARRAAAGAPRAARATQLIEPFSRQNGILGVAIFVPGADFPVLTLNQIRLVLRLAAAHGVEIDQRAAARRCSPTVGAGLRLPHRRPPAARRRPGRRLGGQGRRRLRAARARSARPRSATSQLGRGSGCASRAERPTAVRSGS